MAFSSHFKAQMSLDSAKFEQGLTKAQGRVKKFNSELGGMFTRFLGATALVAFGKNILDTTAKLGDMSTRLGVSTDFLQKFNFAMEQNGVNAEGAQVGLQRFIRRIGTARDEGGALKDTLDQMNISLNDANGNAKSGEDLFLEFADGLGEIENPSAKLATAFKFLDSEGVAMLQTIGDGSKRFRELGKEAENLGLIIDGKTITTMQGLDAELKKQGVQFKVLGASVLPVLLKGLNLSINGWKGIIEVVKMSITGFQILGKTIREYVLDTFEKVSTQIDLFVAKVNLSMESISPFSSDESVAKAQANLDKVEKKYAETAQRTSKSFIETRDSILSKDTDLNNRRTKHIENIKRIQKTSNDILNDRNEVNLKDLSTEKQRENVLQRINKSREDINSKIQLALERVNALKKGGEGELNTVIKRQKAEEQITKLMNDGNITREEAKSLVNQMMDLEEQEKKIKEELKQKETEINAERKKREDNQKILQALSDEKKFAKELENIQKKINDARAEGDKVLQKKLEQEKINLQVGKEEIQNKEKVRKELQDNLNLIKQKRNEADKELQILNLMADGRVDEANKLQDILDIHEDIKTVMDDLQITEKEAIDNLEKKLDLEKQIAKAKITDKKQEIVQEAVQDQAGKDINLGMDKDERARARAGRDVIRLNKKIADLRKRDDKNAVREVQRLEGIRDKKQDKALDNDAKQKIAELDKQKAEIDKQFQNQKGELDKKLADIKAEEKKIQDNQKKNIQDLDDKKKKILDDQQKVIKEGTDIIRKVGNDLVAKLQNGFNAVIAKLPNNLGGGGGKITIDDKGSSNNNLFSFPKTSGSGSSSSSPLNEIQQAVSNMPNSVDSNALGTVPNTPEPPPVNISIEIGTDDLLSEATGTNIYNVLQGKFVNQ